MKVFTLKRIVGAAAVVASVAATTAGATTIDFGVSWPASFTGQGNGNFASSPYDRVLDAQQGTPGNNFSTEVQIAALLNDVLNTTTWGAADINKYPKPTELGGLDGYFNVGAGWDYLIVQYDGSNGGSVVVQLDGNDAKVPFDSASIWGSGDQYAVSHYSLAGPHSVPDGGSTVMLLGSGLLAFGLIRRKLKD